MRTLGLTGLALGKKPFIAVNQNGQTAGPVDVSACPEENSGGLISIVMARTGMKCAPDSVRFSVDLSQAGFDTKGPGGGETYDLRLHDLIYLWDFGDQTGNGADDLWGAPVNVLDEWRKRSVAKGPWVAHVYGRPGIFMATVCIIEPDSGKTATASVQVTVTDPGMLYPGANTICINPVGDSDFTGAPIGSKKVNVNALKTTDRAWKNQQRGTPKRWLFKRGGRFTLGIQLDSRDANNLMFGAYGAGARPILSPYLDRTNKNRCIFVENRYQRLNGLTVPDLRIWGLAFQGNYDPVTENQSIDGATKAKNAIRVNKHADVVIFDCTMAGFFKSAMGFYSNGTSRRNVHIDNCIVTDFGGQYPVFFAPNTNPAGSASITGCRLAQNPDAVDDPGLRAPVRINHIAYTHMRGCDVFHTDRRQPCLKLAETPVADGMVVNVHSCALEGGLWPLSFGNNAGQGLKRSSVHNMIVDGFVIIGDYGTQHLIKSTLTGLTVRNCLAVQPANKKYSTRLPAFVLLQKFDGFDATIVGAAPIRLYNNTFRIDRTTDQNRSDTGGIIRDQTGRAFTAVSEENNILHMPKFDRPSVAFGPLAEIALWVPRAKGRRDPDTYVLDTSYATPADAVKDSRPLIGSPALGAALNGDVSYQDIQLGVRPDPPSQGAWEMK